MESLRLFLQNEKCAMKIQNRIRRLDKPHTCRMAINLSGVEKILDFMAKQFATRDGRWFLVRIMPYRTLENRIDGVVITFSNITEAKQLEAQLRQTQTGTGKSRKKGTS